MWVVGNKIRDIPSTPSRITLPTRYTLVRIVGHLKTSRCKPEDTLYVSQKKPRNKKRTRNSLPRKYVPMLVP